MDNMYIKKNEHNSKKELKKDSRPSNRFASFISLMIVIAAFFMVIVPKKTIKVENKTGIPASSIPYEFAGNGWKSYLKLTFTSTGPRIERTIFSPQGERSFAFFIGTYCGSNVCFYDQETDSDVVISRIDDESIQYDASFRKKGDKQTLVFSH
ncbi:TPA: hypothetical protein ACQWMF_001458 [Neisseria subflava]|jgi:hypothetical protein|uniref:hypothetical protein n=2 Tax=unclassified Neisseria TaxID=2623750 RepID=UPI0008A1BC77|nr:MULTISPECIES: hypothetical protein [unclassified Neisseria]MDU8023162.1 hypothetical protein [Neisseria sp.]OFP80387.1 hypothetical protein HMPREF2972_01780 [Neisseria sp. HMSC066B07]OHQ29445.1 hypothetical protein HMPREF2669_04350 [Neisseria sp. HMSC066F04]OHR18116.1 hypothetical protein HMPREF2560_08815 [Neisseria sp. HMSC078H04]